MHSRPKNRKEKNVLLAMFIFIRKHAQSSAETQSVSKHSVSSINYFRFSIPEACQVHLRSIHVSSPSFPCWRQILEFGIFCSQWYALNQISPATFKELKKTENKSCFIAMRIKTYSEKSCLNSEQVQYIEDRASSTKISQWLLHLLLDIWHVLTVISSLHWRFMDLYSIIIK